MRAAVPPTVFLDFDDVICLNRNYGGHSVFSPDAPDELWERLFHPPAVEVLRELVDEFSPRFVLTTNWVRRVDRDGVADLLSRGGLIFLPGCLHDQWQAPTMTGRERREAIEAWIHLHHQGEPFVVVDDERSGADLTRSVFHADGRLVLCKPGEGLHRGYLPQIRSALTRSPESQEGARP